MSGTAGMSLATVVRLEFAYPGIGVLAGDSLQYLSIATAHGVIMVFFMIMPLIFGGFGNFLLPTQLGVHDVAFPRLNSAAFWFLPGGLIMLCQLVCIDRRYQRMNCFNIRELQGILKRRFFTDLVNTHDFHELLDESMIGLRFKNNDTDNVTPNTALFYNYGLNTSAKNKSIFMTNSSTLGEDYKPVMPSHGWSYNLTSLGEDSLTNSLYRLLSEFNALYTGNITNSYRTPTDSLVPTIFNLTELLKELFSTFYLTIYSVSVLSLTNLISTFKSVLFINFINPLYLNLNNYSTNILTVIETPNSPSTQLTSNSSNFSNQLDTDASDHFVEESNFRFTRFTNALISYDYKCGNYVGV